MQENRVFTQAFCHPRNVSAGVRAILQQLLLDEKRFIDIANCRQLFVYIDI